MSSSFPNGTIFSVYTTQAAAKAISGITNANPGVVSSTAHGYTDGDVILLSVAGARLNNRPVKVAGSVTNAWNLSGIDTTSTSLYPSGFGVGSSYKVTVPVSLSQVVDSATSGGEQQFYQWVYLEGQGTQLQRPTFRSAKSQTLTMDWDPNLAWHAALLNASDNGGVFVIKALLPTAAELYWGMYVSFDGEPDFVSNQNMQTKVTFSFANPYSTRY